MNTTITPDNGRPTIAPDPRGFPTKSSVFGQEDIEKRTKQPRWEYKTKRLRRQELLDTL
jgi:hypothetical protein